MQRNRTAFVALVGSPHLTSPAAHRAAARRQELRPELCRNPHLDEELWTSLYTHRPKVAVEQAKQLAGRKLTRRQAEHILSKESRTSVLTSLVEHNTLDLDLQERVLETKGFTPNVAEAWMAAGTVHPLLERRVALVANRETLLRWLARQDSTVVPDSEAIEVFSHWNGWDPVRGYENGLLEEVLTRRPGLLGAFVTHKNWTVRRAAAASSLLRGPALQYALAQLTPDQQPLRMWEYGSANLQVLRVLVQNPNLDPELARLVVRLGEGMGANGQVIDHAQRRLDLGYDPIDRAWDDVTDADQLEAIAEYVCGGGNVTSVLSPSWELENLAGNPHLPEARVRQLGSQLMYGVRAKSDTTRARAIERFRAVHGEDHLQNMWGNRRSSGPYEPLPSEPVDYGTLPAARLLNGAKTMVEWTVTHLGENEDAWDVLLTLVEGFEGTLADLVDVAVHI